MPAWKIVAIAAYFFGIGFCAGVEFMFWRIRRVIPGGISNNG